MFKILLSPAKSIDTTVSSYGNPSTPFFEYEAEQLILKLKKMNPKALGELMSISEKLADLNWSRFQNWKPLKKWGWNILKLANLQLHYQVERHKE